MCGWALYGQSNHSDLHIRHANFALTSFTALVARWAFFQKKKFLNFLFLRDQITNVRWICPSAMRDTHIRARHLALNSIYSPCCHIYTCSSYIMLWITLQKVCLSPQNCASVPVSFCIYIVDKSSRHLMVRWTTVCLRKHMCMCVWNCS